MKIALFTETYLPYLNGVVTHVKTLCDGFTERGHQVLVVCADPDTNKHFVKDGVLHCPAISFKKFYNYGIAMPLSLGRSKYLEIFEPDIIHIHQEFGIGLSGMFIAKRLGVPLVYTLHTMYDEYLYYIAPKPFIRLAKKTSHRYTKFLAKRASMLTGPSQKVEDYFKTCGINKKVHIIPNSIEFDMFSISNIPVEKIVSCREKLGVPKDMLLACFCGRLGKEKSVDVMLRFWANTIKHEDKMRLLIIGDGPSKQELIELTKELNLEDDVIFVGKIPHDEIAPYYACSDLYLTTSLTEMYSISMLEAMATGLPVFHLYDEKNSSQIKNGINGFIFHNEEEMARLLKEYRDKPDEEKEAFRKGVVEYLNNSNSKNLISTVLGVYEEALAEKKIKEQMKEQAKGASKEKFEKKR